MTVGTMGTSDVQGNTISNINFSTTIELLQQQGFFQNFCFAGTVNIGSTNGNTIGSTTEMMLFRFHLPLP
jgi:hypothetical protein